MKLQQIFKKRDLFLHNKGDKMLPLSGFLPGLPLIKKFAVLSALTLSLLGFFLARDISQFVLDQLVEVYKEGALISAKLVMGHHIKAEDLTGPFSPDRLVSLTYKLKDTVTGTKIIQLKVWNKDSRVIYSNNNEFIGMQEPANRTLARAFKGETIVDWAETGEHFRTLPDKRKILEIYMPIEFNGSVVGVYEVYWDSTTIDEHVESTRRYIWSLIAASFVIMYVALFKYVYDAAKTIAKQDRFLNTLSKRLAESLGKNRASYRGAIESLLAALDAKDRYTAAHSIRVADYSVMLGRALNLPEDRLKLLEEAALFHDIGKIGIPETVLGKPGNLDSDEAGTMREHPRLGAQIIETMEDFAEHARVIRHHHERWDGKGYPYNLAGESIPLESRILAVADTYDALTSDRPYRKGQPKPDALRVLEECSWKQLDSNLVSLFIQLNTKI